MQNPKWSSKSSKVKNPLYKNLLSGLWSQLSTTSCYRISPVWKFQLKVTTATYGLQATTVTYGLQATTATYGLQATTATYGLQTTTATYGLQATTATYGLQRQKPAIQSADRYLPPLTDNLGAVASESECIWQTQCTRAFLGHKMED